MPIILNSKADKYFVLANYNFYKGVNKGIYGDGIINEKGVFDYLEGYDAHHIVLPIKTSDTVHVKSGTQQMVISILSEYKEPKFVKQQVVFATGESIRVIAAGGSESTFTVSAVDAKYMVININYDNISYIPQILTINGYDVLSSIEEDIIGIKNNPFISGVHSVHQDIDLTTDIENGFYYPNSTRFTSNDDFTCSDFIEVSADSVVTAEVGCPYNVSVITLFDSNKTAIGWVIGTDIGKTFEIYNVQVSNYPNAKYVRISCRNAYKNSATVTTIGDDSYTVDDLLNMLLYDRGANNYVKPLSAAKNFIGHSEINIDVSKYLFIPCYGQSLSNGSDSLYVEDPVVQGCYMLGDIVGTTEKLTPLQLTSGHQHPIVSCVNSLAVLMKKYYDRSCKFIAASVGIGGRSIAQLSKASRITEYAKDYDYSIKDSGGYENCFLSSLDNAIAAVGAGNVECPAIIYLQGERDYVTDSQAPDAQLNSVDAAYACGGDKDMYKSRMMDLKNDMQADIMAKFGQSYKPIFCIYEVSGPFIKNDQMTINMAQIEFAQENDDVYLMPSPYFVPDYGAHLSTNGYRWYGEFLAKALFGILCQNSYWKPILPYQYKIDDYKIIISLENNVGKLQFDTTLVEQSTNNGFAVYINDSYSVSNISNVEIDDNHIVITCNQSLTGKKVEVVYGGNKTSGSGNVRDNDVYRAMYTYWDDSNDNGSDGTKTIGYRPAIIGDKYPMYNWLASFYQLVNNPT